MDPITLLTLFVLAVFVGFEVVSKVSSTLHTPLMSGANAIHGIILVGAIIVAGEAHTPLILAAGLFAVLLATVNLVGGFVVKKNQPVTLEATYTVPVGTAFGTYDSGMLFDVNAFSTQQGLNPINVNVQVVDPSVATGTTLVAPATAKVGTPVDLTATVAPSDASGTVQFKDGGNDIGSPVPVSGGSATLSHTFDSVGAHDITAAYNAGPGFHSSTSGVQTVDVSADTTTTISAPNAALVGDSITVSAVVTPANAVGTVQFKDGETNLGAPVAVVNGTASLTRSYDASGTHSFTAVFTGEAGYGDSVSTATRLGNHDHRCRTTHRCCR